MLMNKTSLKQFLGELPFTAEAYWHLRQPGMPLDKRFTLEQLQAGLPEWSRQAARFAELAPAGKDLLIFSTLHYWVSHAALIGLALAGLGHKVTLAYLPYGKWQNPLNRFDLRRQNLYARSVLKNAAPLVQAVSLLDVKLDGGELPKALEAAIEEISLKDTQYTLQVEVVDPDSDLYRLRMERNLQAACAALQLMRSSRPETVLIPNGTILEFGAVFQSAHYLKKTTYDFPLVTYEFGEQRQRIWLARNAEVMRQRTDDLWSARGGRPLSAGQLEKVQALFSARQGASPWENFARRWQGAPSAGGEQARADLGLDARPVVLLATNVIGDSLTLGRQVFSDSMTAWLERTVRYFAARSDVQLVVRIHPGELVTQGPSVADVVARILPDLPENIRLVPASSKVNTYDLVEIADLGLVYTTTVGLEIAMSGVPAIVIGHTHYREKGFTLDPQTWEAYFQLLDQVIAGPEKYRLEKEQVARAWEYAYRFFFEYPHPFPWHLVHLWEDVVEWPVGRVLEAEGLQHFGKTLAYLAGEPVDWNSVIR
jgi:hypothetical protein